MRSSLDISLSFAGFIATSLLAEPLHEPAPYRELVPSEPHRFLRDLLRNAFHLVDDLARSHYGDPTLGRPLALAHARLGRLLRDRLVREHADPDLAAALDEPGD